MNHTNRRAPLRLTASFAALLPASAIAQGIDTPQDLGTIVLGESKREVQTETATPVTVVDQEEIDDRQASTIAELIDSVPGVTLVNGDTPSGSGISIRGFGANSTFGTDQKVIVLQDGSTQGSQEVYRLGTQLFTEPELFKEVEVIRGPVGTFEYASGAVGGLMNLTTKDASDFTLGERIFAGRQMLQYSSNGDGLLSSTILAFQPQENVELLFNYIWREQGDKEDAEGNKIGNSAYKLPSYFAKAKFSFGDANDQSLTFVYNKTSSQDRDVPYDTFNTSGGFFGNVDRDTESQTAVLEYRYAPPDNDLIDLSVNLSYAEADVEQTYVPGSSPIAPPGGFSTVNADLNYKTTKLTIKNISLIETGNVTHNLRYGIEFMKIKRAEAASAPGGTDDRVALFVVDEMQIGDAWTFTPALRYERSKIQDSEDPNGKYDNSALMGQLSLRYAFGNGAAVFANAAYTESLPILDDLRNSFTFAPQPALMTRSEKAVVYEIGASLDRQSVFTAGDELALKAVFYDLRLRDVTSISGVDRVEQQGLEFEASYTMDNGFYTDLNFNITDGDEVLKAGTRRQYRYTPSDSVNLTVGKKFGKELDISWEMVARKKYTDTVTPSRSAPGYARHNLRATYKPQKGWLEGAEVRLGVDNLFNKAVTPRRSTRPRPGRNITLTVAKTF